MWGDSLSRAINAPWHSKICWKLNIFLFHIWNTYNFKSNSNMTCKYFLQSWKKHNILWYFRSNFFMPSLGVPLKGRPPSVLYLSALSSSPYWKDAFISYWMWERVEIQNSHSDPAFSLLNMYMYVFPSYTELRRLYLKAKN